MSDTHLPNDIAGLIKLLETTYPLKTFPVSADAVVIQRYFGARDVIDFLKALHRERVTRIREIG